MTIIVQRVRNDTHIERANRWHLLSIARDMVEAQDQMQYSRQQGSLEPANNHVVNHRTYASFAMEPRHEQASVQEAKPTNGHSTC